MSNPVITEISPVASHKDDPFTAAFSGFAVLFPGQFRIRKGRQDLRRWEWDRAKHLLLVLCPILCVCYDWQIALNPISRGENLFLVTSVTSPIFSGCCAPEIQQWDNPFLLWVGCAHFTISVG